MAVNAGSLLSNSARRAWHEREPNGVRAHATGVARRV